MAKVEGMKNPYVGPRPFGPEDRALFFGRDEDAIDILALIASERVLLLYGQSGAGKTSLIVAKLIPLLESEGFEVYRPARVQGHLQGDELKSARNYYVLNALKGWSSEIADTKYTPRMSLSTFLGRRTHKTDNLGFRVPRVLIFDQFEELLIHYPERWKDREGFFRQVHAALRSDSFLRIVFSMREDYIARLDPFAQLLPGRLLTRYRLERLDPRAAFEAITKPLRGTNRHFGKGVADILVEELLKNKVEAATGQTMVVSGEFVEPVQLQVVCQTLWNNLPFNVSTITHDHLKIFGNVDSALQRFYEDALREAVHVSHISERRLRAWFDTTMITPAGTRGTAYGGLSKAGGISTSALAVFEEQHLIRGEWRAGARWYELTHDRFIEPIQESNRLYTQQRANILETVSAAESELRQGNARNVEKLVRDALTDVEALHDTQEAAVQRMKLADLAANQGTWDEAERLYRQAHASFTALDDKQQVAVSRGKLADLAASRGNLDEAEDLLQNALVEFSALDDRLQVAVSRGKLADLAASRGNLDKAERLNREALAEFFVLGDHLQVAVSTGKLADLAASRGNWDEAERLNREALAEFSALGDHRNIAVQKGKLADLAASRGNWDEAERLNREALQEYRGLGALVDESVQSYNLAGLLRGRGRVAEAVELMERVVEIDRQINYSDLQNDLAKLEQYRAEVTLGVTPGPPVSQALVFVLAEFVNAPDWDASRKVLDAHPELLTPEADVALEQIINDPAGRDKPEIVDRLKMHREVLRLCREVGIEAAFEQITASPLDVFAQNTIAVLTTVQDKAEEWFKAMQGLHAEAEQHHDQEMLELTGAIVRLLVAKSAAGIEPRLSGEHAACWAKIVAGIAEGKT